MRSLFALPLILFPLSAQAQEVSSCHEAALHQTSLLQIAEPWEQHSRTFANGAVRVTLLDTIEPAVVPFHLVIQHPPYDAEMGILRQCSSIGPFSGLDFASLESSYDPAIGLVFTFDGQRPNPEFTEFEDIEIQIGVNQATGAVALDMEAK